MTLLDKIFTNKHNQKLLSFLKIIGKDKLYFEQGDKAGDPFDEGSKTFFYKYGKNLPQETKVSVSVYNLLVNPENGLIFGFQWGRFTFVIRCDFSKIAYLKNADKYRQAETLDAYVDFTELGENWCITNYFDEDEDIHFQNAYQLSKTYV